MRPIYKFTTEIFWNENHHVTERFWSKITIDNNGCWIFNTASGFYGYRCFSVNGKQKPAHRFSYEVFKGGIPEKFVIDHLCKNVQCVNPDHLEAVTHKENICRGDKAATKALDAWTLVIEEFGPESSAEKKKRRRSDVIQYVEPKDTHLGLVKRFGNMPSFDKPIGWDGKNFQETFKTKELPFLTTEKYGWHSAISKFANRLVWGDNLAVMRSMPSETLDLIYIDPPFFSGRDYNCIFGDDDEVRTFSDIWDGGLPTYLAWLNARLWEMKRLLKPTGSLFVHLDWHASHYAKVELDKIFGYDNFLNEIVWHYSQGGKSTKHFARKHDVLLWYSKTDNYFFDAKGVRLPFTPHKQSKSGRNFGGRMGKDENGREYVEKWGTGKKKLYRYYLDEGKIPEDVWSDIQSIQAAANERIGYPTQKPEALVQRVIKAACPKDGVVADFFSGGGTTILVAEKLGRKWIGCDVSRIAISVVRDRLTSCYSKVVGVPPENSHPTTGFLIQNHGA